MSDDKEVHGFKLVHRDTYAPLVATSWSASAPQRYVPGSTQWIVWNHACPPPPMHTCTSSVLHFCKRAVETAMFTCGFDTDGLALVRVTPVRWNNDAEDRDADTLLAPLFVEDHGTVSIPKCGARGLRVDGEVTDVAERRALLSGVVEYVGTGSPRQGKSVTTFDGGHLVRIQEIDVLGNCVVDYGFRDGVRFNGSNFVYVDASAADEGSKILGDWDIFRVLDTPGLTTVVYGQLDEKNMFSILKRYTKTEIDEQVIAASLTRVEALVA